MSAFPKIEILAAAAEDQELGGAALRVLVLLIKHADNKTGLCYPSQSGLARSLSISRPAVTQSIEKLHKKGFLKVKKRQLESGAKTTNIYQISLPPMLAELTTPSKPTLPPPQADLTTPPLAELTTINSSNLELLQLTPTPEPGGDRKKRKAKGEGTRRTADGDLPPAFVEFWTAYPNTPHKGGRPKTLKLWTARLKETNSSPADVLKALEAFKADLEQKNTEERFIPGAGRFLSDRLEYWLAATASSQAAGDTEESPRWRIALQTAEKQGDEQTATAIRAALRTADFVSALAIADAFLDDPAPSKKSEPLEEALEA